MIIELVGITNSESLRKVVDDETVSDASNRDRIASAKKLTITEPMDDDPALSKELSRMPL